MITGFYAGLLGFWMIFLMLRVVRARLKYQVGLGDGGHKEVIKATRIHGNFTETVPYVLLIMLLLEMQNYNPWIIHAFGTALLLSRMIHFFGITQSSGKSAGRMWGTILVMLLLAIGGGLLMSRMIVSYL